MFSVESLSPESLSHVGPYPTRAFDLARYVDDPTDDLVDELVGHASNRKPAELDEWRGKLNEQDRYTLLQFARRRSAQGLRSERPDLVLQAVHTLTLVEREKIDYRDLSVDFPLYAVRQLGISTDEVIDMAVLRSSLGTTQAFEASRLRARSATLADCALIQISSKYGLGFMEAWTRDYDTATGVAELSIEIADSIDTEGTYTALTLRVGHLPGVWFSLQRAMGDVPASACVRVDCQLVGAKRWSHGLLIFVADVGSSSLAEDLAVRAQGASDSSRPRVTINSGQRLILLVGGSATSGEAPRETAKSLNRFRIQLASKLERCR